MHNTSFMCSSPMLAAQNRQRVHDGYATLAYSQQAAAIAGWLLGKPKPDSIVTDDLPVIQQRHYHPFALWHKTDE